MQFGLKNCEKSIGIHYEISMVVSFLRLEKQSSTVKETLLSTLFELVG